MYVCAQLIIDAPDVNIKLVPASESSFTNIFFTFSFFLNMFFSWRGGEKLSELGWMEPKIYRKRDGVLRVRVTSFGRRI